MIALRTILVPTDFSETAETALTYAKALAETFNASLHLLHVLQDPLVYAPVAEGYTVLPKLREEMEREAQQQLENVLSDPERRRFHAVPALKWGTPFLEIVRYARDQQIDLIVLGTHGRGPITHLLLGSVAEKVVRKAPCPVLTVRPPAHHFVMP
jgi:nucleotide-binding universal stress UspA family protein